MPATRTADVIVNAGSGAADHAAAAERLVPLFTARGVGARVHVARSGRELATLAQRAATSDSGIIVGGGGDGTIAAVAAAAVASGKTLGVLPLGTFNYLARALDLPGDLEPAVDVICGDHVRALDVAQVNGRVFINNASIGLYPAVLERRESTYGRLGRSRMAAYLSVALVLLEPPAFLDVRVTIDGTPVARRTPLLFVGVNAHQLESFGIEGSGCVADGKFAAYITRPLRAPQLVRLALRAAVRGLYGASELEVVCASTLRVDMRRRRVRVAMDGEVVTLDTPLQFDRRTGALRVAVPSPAPA